MKDYSKDYPAIRWYWGSFWGILAFTLLFVILIFGHFVPVPMESTLDGWFLVLWAASGFGIANMLYVLTLIAKGTAAGRLPSYCSCSPITPCSVDST